MRRVVVDWYLHVVGERMKREADCKVTKTLNSRPRPSNQDQDPQIGTKEQGASAHRFRKEEEDRARVATILAAKVCIYTDFAHLTRQHGEIRIGKALYNKANFIKK